jgi:hypothetical protein
LSFCAQPERAATIEPHAKTSTQRLRRAPPGETLVPLVDEFMKSSKTTERGLSD